jgi:hypothetical protein
MLSLARQALLMQMVVLFVDFHHRSLLQMSAMLKPLGVVHLSHMDL